ncbi:diacylglycerol kinase family protein [Benzoatithermus flavus]|uniref:Diacylglycerol kinase family protein n=1 Tax=Benzoatithermus flavus TaxID=3108223 RepID=A0ABU8XVC0_9PROT
MNPRSGRRGKRGLVPPGGSDLLVRAFEAGAAMSEILADLARREVRLIAVDGGDGTLQALLTALLASPVFPALPALAVLPGGSTNMTAAALGAGPRRPATLARLCALARTGRLEPYLRHHPVLKVERAPNRPAERGLFLGAAGICGAIRLCARRFHRHGLRGEWSSLATLLSVLGRLVFRGTTGLDGETIAITADGETKAHRPCSFALATTLDRLVLGSRPFWNVGDRPIRVTAVAHPAPDLARHAWSLLCGRGARLPAETYHSRGAFRVELALERPFTIDGEFFAPVPGRPVVITAAETVPFLRLPP